MIEQSTVLQMSKKVDTLLASQASMEETLQIILQELIKPENKYVYGIHGLANFLHCSKSTAQKIKDSGKIDQATVQFERNVFFDTGKVFELLKVRR